jgi:geranylgeranyl diphosphate synthase type I
MTNDERRALDALFARYIPLIESDMRDSLSAPDPALAAYYGMLHYHLGWADEHFAPTPTWRNSGKRIRPMLCLLACQSAQGDAMQAIPAAASIELVHNFSLIHDDIEDNSPNRRGRPSVWALWGVPQAINSGDGLFAIAHLAMDRLRDRGVSYERILAVRSIFDSTCLALTHGQYLDMSFESRLSVSVDEYMSMVSGKTAALIGAATAIGATLAGSSAVAHYATFGRELGLAFQIQDDILGIWGDEALTGKSAESDIATKKKSLPVVYALGRSEKLRALYAASEVDVPTAVAEMDAIGARAFAAQAAREHHECSLAALRASGASGDAGQALLDLAESLMGRAA